MLSLQSHANSRSQTGASSISSTNIEISRSDYANKLHGFWLGQCIANWTGLVTEMDKIGGEGPHGKFYTRDDWGKPDQPSIWDEGKPSTLSPTIDFVVKGEGEIWGADDDTDLEYLYQHLLFSHQVTRLTPEQIREGWLKHIYSDDNTPFRDKRGKPENYLWVSNQKAHDLMRLAGVLPPATSDPKNNPHYEMIDAQLTTEIFGLFAPANPSVALAMAQLPIQTTARFDAQWAAEFYVIMHSLAAAVDSQKPLSPQLQAIALEAREHLPEQSYLASMFDFVYQQYQRKARWEDVRDQLHIKYQVHHEAGYDVGERDDYCNGCFAAGINFGASLISLFYGEGDIKETIKIASLAGWDSDNPAATWGGLLGFIYGYSGVETAFGQKFSNTFNIHRTRGNFPNDGIDTFEAMAQKGIAIIDRVVEVEMNGVLDVGKNVWVIPRGSYEY